MNFIDVIVHGSSDGKGSFWLLDLWLVTRGQCGSSGWWWTGRDEVGDGFRHWGRGEERPPQRDLWQLWQLAWGHGLQRWVLRPSLPFLSRCSSCFSCCSSCLSCCSSCFFVARLVFLVARLVFLVARLVFTIACLVYLVVRLVYLVARLVFLVARLVFLVACLVFLVARLVFLVLVRLCVSPLCDLCGWHVSLCCCCGCCLFVVVAVVAVVVVVVDRTSVVDGVKNQIYVFVFF